MNVWQRSLAARLLGLFLLLAIAPVVVTGYMAYDSGRQSIVSNVEAHLESVAILKEQEIRSWVTHLEHTITLLATNPQTASAVATLATHTASDPEYLAAHDSLVAEFRRVAALGHLSPVFVLDSASGQVIASSDTGLEGQFRDTETWFIQGKTSAYVSDIFHSVTLGRPTMVIASPVTDSDGQLLMVLASNANLEGLSEIMLERSGLGETGETYLVNKGNLLLTESRAEPGAAFKKWVFTEGVRRALGGESGVDLYLGHSEEPIIGAYQWLEGKDMVLLAEIDQTEAFVPIMALRNAVLGIGLGVALIVALLGVLVARTITGPVHQLVGGAKEIGQGNLGYRIEVRGRDEIGQLSRAFNQMAQDLHVVTASRDELNKEIAERVRAQADLERSNRDLEQFAYVASHDLQEPLRTVSGYLQLLERRYAGALDEDAGKFITRSVGATARMKTMINVLLTFSRVGARGKPFDPTDCSLVLDQAMADLKTAIDESGADITHDSLPTLMADGSQLVELFQNLLGNAIKFRGERPPEIHVGAKYVRPSQRGDSSHGQAGGDGSGAHWLFSVRDNGIGIEEQYAERIFVIFQRLHTRTEYPGTGIGLAVCKKIIERHGGRIWFESEPGAGSTFYFTVPEREGGNLS